MILFFRCNLRNLQNRRTLEGIRKNYKTILIFFIFLPKIDFHKLFFLVQNKVDSDRYVPDLSDETIRI